MIDLGTGSDEELAFSEAEKERISREKLETDMRFAEYHESQRQRPSKKEKKVFVFR